MTGVAQRFLSAVVLPAVVVTCGLAQIAQAASITVNNLDGAGEGFNDPTPVAPVGGNPGTTLGDQRLNVFDFAADIWGGIVDSVVTIEIDANMDPLSCSSTSATLGAAGANTVHRDFTGTPVSKANTWFVQAEANSLSGSDLSGNADLEATFNSTLDLGGTCLGGMTWYYGFDGLPPAGTTDFVSVVLHEIAHGLGFLSLMDLSTGAKLLGRDDIYSDFLADRGGIGKAYPDMTDAERVSASRSVNNLVWTGTEVNTNEMLTAGKHAVTGEVLMYAPNPQEPGASVSHFDTTLFLDELMEPFATVPLLDVGLTADLFADILWPLLGGPGGGPGGFMGWSEVPGGGFTPSGPEVIVFEGNRWIFVRGTNDRIYQNVQINAVWSGWSEVPGGGVTFTKPGAVVFNSELYVFVRGTDSRIYVNRLTAGGWSGWSEVPGGGFTPSMPTGAVLNGVLYLFVRGTDDRLYVNTLDGSWSGWNEVPGGGLTLAAPRAIVFESVLYLLVRGTDNRVYDNLLTLAGWTGWREVPGGGSTPAGLGAAVFEGGLDYFRQDTDLNISRNRLPNAGGSWTGWSEIFGAGLTLAGPGAAADSNTECVVVQGTDSKIYINEENAVPLLGAEAITADSEDGKFWRALMEKENDEGEMLEE